MGLACQPGPWLISTARFKAIDGMRAARHNCARASPTYNSVARRLGSGPNRRILDHPVKHVGCHPLCRRLRTESSSNLVHSCGYVPGWTGQRIRPPDGARREHPIALSHRINYSVMVMIFPDPLIRARMKQARSQYLQAGNVGRLAVIFPTDDGRNPVAGAEPCAFVYPVFRFRDHPVSVSDGPSFDAHQLLSVGHMNLARESPGRAARYGTCIEFDFMPHRVAG